MSEPQGTPAENESPTQTTEPIDTRAEPPPAVTAAPAPAKRSFAWWSLLLSYLVLLTAVGYLAFMLREAPPALDANLGQQSAAISDDMTRKVFLDGIAEETTQQKKKGDLAFHSFNIVLGAVLGFLAASAASAAKAER